MRRLYVHLKWKEFHQGKSLESLFWRTVNFAHFHRLFTGLVETE